MSHYSPNLFNQAPITTCTTTWPPTGYPVGQTSIVAVCLHRDGVQGESQVLQHATFQQLDEAKAFAETMAQMVGKFQLSATEAACFRCAVLQLTITDSGMDIQFLHECPITAEGIQS